MDDLEHLALEILLIIGALCLGVVLGSKDRRSLPPPDSKAQRNRVSYL